MIEHSPHAGIKSEALRLWNGNRPLALALLIGGGFLLFLWWRHTQGTSTTPPADTTSASGLPTSFISTVPGTPGAPHPVSPLPPIPVNPLPPIPIIGGRLPQQPGSTPPPGPKPPNPNNPLIPYGQLPGGTQYILGKTLNWQGTMYTIGPGSGGRLWGVPGNVSIANWQTTPIAPGQKVLLYGPASLYS